MATFVYVGLPGREPSPDGITIRGVHFPLGESVDVADANLAAKLGRMREFRCVESASDIAADPVSDVVPAPAEPAAPTKRRGRPPKVRPVTEEPA